MNRKKVSFTFLLTTFVAIIDIVFKIVPFLYDVNLHQYAITPILVLWK